MNQHEQKHSGSARDNEWAVILAGGDGTRLRSLTLHIAGDDRPKQFCSVLRGATLLEETQSLAACPPARAAALPVFYEASVRLAQRFGAALTTREASGAALWFPPSRRDADGSLCSHAWRTVG